MRPFLAIALILLLIETPLGAYATTARPAPPVILEAVNAVRAQSGLPPLAWDERLTLAASRHAEDLQRCGEFSHTGCNGSDLAMRLSRAEYPYRFAAENLALCDCDAVDVVRLWLNSEGHRRNMLNREVTEMGAELRIDQADPRRSLWVLVLGHTGN